MQSRVNPVSLPRHSPPPPPILISSPITTSFNESDLPPLVSRTNSDGSSHSQAQSLFRVDEERETSPSSYISKASYINRRPQLSPNGTELYSNSSANNSTSMLQLEKRRQGSDGQTSTSTTSPKIASPSEPWLPTSPSLSSIRSSGDHDKIPRLHSFPRSSQISPDPNSPLSPQVGAPREQQNKATSSDSKLPPSISHRSRPYEGARDLFTSQPRLRSTPRIQHEKDAEVAPTMGMLWYRAPVHGAMPGRTLRSHSATLVGQKIWVIGGYDEKQSYRDMYCLDIDTLYWAHPDFKGDVPPPCRGHTATAVEHKIVIIGGTMVNPCADSISVYIFDTTTHTWACPRIAPGIHPSQRRAHSAVLYNEKIWIFGGGNGMTALSDIWSLDVSTLIDARRATITSRHERSGLRWEKVEIPGGGPAARGYHTANIVDHLMIVIGGADGKGALDDVWVLNLANPAWMHVSGLQGSPTRRLAHSSTQVGSYLFLFGGFDKEYTSELSLLNLVSLQIEDCRINGKIPAPRGYHTTILGDTRLFVIGGVNATNTFDDVYILELASHAYLPQITEFSIEPLVDAGMYRK